MKKISILLSVLMMAAGASAQTVTFKNTKGNTKGTFNLNEVSKIVYTPKDPNAIIDPDEVEDLDKFQWNIGAASAYYKSKDDMFDADTHYNFRHMKQSEHFFLFWDSDFGDDPKNLKSSNWAYVDTDDLLEKAEQFFKTNVETLKMCTVGQDVSYLDQYKMQIWLIYDSGWTATGSGWGDIGCLWITPSTCKPVGSTVAHEIGHSFQYQVGADNSLKYGKSVSNYGWRYGFGGNGGCTYWEQCAQWQSFQDYPEQMFQQDFAPWPTNYYRHFMHEWMRYQSYWFQYYLVSTEGIEAYGRLWQESVSPEDPLQTYCRLYCDGDWDKFWENYVDYCTRVLTYDFDWEDVTYAKNLSANKTNASPTRYAQPSFFTAADGSYQIAYSSCPETSGMNFVRLERPEDGTLTVKLTALALGSELADSDPGSYFKGDGVVGGTTTTYNKISAQSSDPNFCISYVAIVDGKAVYSQKWSGSEISATYEVPENATDLYLVVVPTPATYNQHAWDDSDLTDYQWPYTISIEGADLYGNIKIDMDADPTNIDFSYDIECDASTSGYELGSLDLSAYGEINKVAQAFVMQPSNISAITGTISTSTTPKFTSGTIAFTVLQPDGTLATSTYTANSGYYINADGSVGSWGNKSPIWIEYDATNFIITYGHYPGVTVEGETYTVKPCLVYTDGDNQYVASFTLNLKF